MKYSPNHPISPLSDDLNQSLLNLRNLRNFKKEDYLEYKLFLIKDYFTKYNLDTAIVALSGGIDSSLVLSILKYSQEKQGIPANIIPITLPAEKSRGVSNQKETIYKAELLCKSLNLTLYSQDLNESNEVIGDSLENEFDLKSSDWARGQLIPYLRTPYLYYTSTLFNDNNKRAVIVGTTNKDEGSYLGYIGKASDAMVDIQLISDIHKSEVINLSYLLKIPLEIIEQIPNGDMFDNRTDVEVFGASYDFVELFLLSKEYNSHFINNLNDESLIQWNQGVKNLTELHNYNKHKYIGHSASVHLDVINYKFPQNESFWKTSSSVKNEDYPIDFNKIVNFKQISNTLTINNNFVFKSIKNHEYIYSLFDNETITNLITELNINEWKRAGIDGYVNTKTDAGSERISFINHELSKSIFNSIQNQIKSHLINNEGLWEAISVSSLFRVIKYNEGDLLLPHYDLSYEYNQNKKTFKSIIIILNVAEDGGELAFIKEKDNLNQDWDRISIPNEREIVLKMNKGDVIIFDHNKLHESLKINKGTKIILRSDLVYDKKNYY